MFQYQEAKLYPKQREAFYNDKRYSLCEASTKAGKTYGAMDWLLSQAFSSASTPAHNYWWVAPVYPQAEIAYNRIKRALISTGAIASFGKLSFRVPNGAAIYFKSAEKPDNLYGEDVYAAVIDEASRVRDESWHAIRSTLTKTRGPVRLIGNVKGRQNFFYRMARKAESGDPSMHYIKIIAADAVAAGVLSAEEIEDARSTLPEQVFRELYLAEPSDDGGNPFGLKAIENCIGELSSEPVEFWGIDLAKSVDWTVAIGLDRFQRVCRFERFQKPWLDTISYLRYVVGYTPALVDSTGVGDAILESLREGGYGNFEGYKFTPGSKQQLMEGLAVQIQQKKITYPAGVIVNELSDFEYEYTRTGVRYTAPEGLHDDCVCGLALAVRKASSSTFGDGVIAYLRQINEERTKQK